MNIVNGNRIGNEYAGMSDLLGLPSAGLESNIIDLCKFIKWHFVTLNESNPNNIISNKTLERMQKIHRVPLPFKLHPIFNLYS